MTKMTQGERLARIETLLEAQSQLMSDGLSANATTARQAVEKLDRIEERLTARFEALEKIVSDDIARLAELENKGKGAFAVASLVFVSVGAFVGALWDSFKGAIFH